MSEKKFRFSYVEECTHEAIVKAENLKEAKDKLENFKTEEDTIVDSDIDYKDTKLIESWEE